MEALKFFKGKITEEEKKNYRLVYKNALETNEYFN